MLQFLHPSHLWNLVVQARGAHLRLVDCSKQSYSAEDVDVLRQLKRWSDHCQMLPVDVTVLACHMRLRDHHQPDTTVPQNPGRSVGLTRFPCCPAQAAVAPSMLSRNAPLTGGACQFTGASARTRGALLDPDEQAMAGNSVATALSIAASAAAALSPDTAPYPVAGPASAPEL